MTSDPWQQCPSATRRFRQIERPVAGGGGPPTRPQLAMQRQSIAGRHTPSVTSLLADVHLAYHVLGRLVARDLEEAAVSMSEAFVLRAVRLNKRMTMRDLLGATGACNSTMASLVTRLEGRKLLERDQLD